MNRFNETSLLYYVSNVFTCVSARGSCSWQLSAWYVDKMKQVWQCSYFLNKGKVCTKTRRFFFFFLNHLLFCVITYWPSVSQTVWSRTCGGQTYRCDSYNIRVSFIYSMLSAQCFTHRDKKDMEEIWKKAAQIDSLSMVALVGRLRKSGDLIGVACYNWDICNYNLG